MKYKITDKISKSVIAEILKVKKECGLTAENIVEYAKDKNNPLHKLFTWDDAIGGMEWRLHQARVLINEVKVIVDKEERYAFESVITINSAKDYNEACEDTKRVYMERKEILDNKQLRTQIVQSAYKQLIYWQEKYRDYAEFSPIFKAMEKIKL